MYQTSYVHHFNQSYLFEQEAEIDEIVNLIVHKISIVGLIYLLYIVMVYYNMYRSINGTNERILRKGDLKTYYY